MPFTFSHPAVALPLNYLLKKRVSFTGLVAGSLVPDFEYFLRCFHESRYTHTWAGLFYADLPGGLLLCFLYHGLVRKPFYAHAPLFIKRKMAFFQWFDWNRFFSRRWKLVLLSVLLGAFSHLVWDKLTHHTVPVVQSVSGLEKVAPALNPEDMYFFFWDIASLIGAAVLLIAFIRQPAKKNIEVNEGVAAYWLLLCGATGAFFYMLFPNVGEDAIQGVVIVFIDAVMLGLLLASLFFTTRTRSKNAFAQAGKKEGEQYRLPS